MTRSGQDEPKLKAGKLAACKTLAYELVAPQTCAGGEFGKLRGRFAPYASVRSHKTWHKPNCGSLRANYGTVPAAGQ